MISPDEHDSPDQHDLPLRHNSPFRRACAQHNPHRRGSMTSSSVTPPPTTTTTTSSKSEEGQGIETVRARSPPIGLYTPQSLPLHPSSNTRAEYRRMRHCEGLLPSTLGLGLFASDETDEGKVLVEDDKALPSYCSLLYDPSHPPPSPSPSCLRPPCTRWWSCC